MTRPQRPNALADDDAYPRPQLVRDGWADLNGEWQFSFGTHEAQTPSTVAFTRTIRVPFPPESRASGVAETGYAPVLWYRRTFDGSDLVRAGWGAESPRVAIRFGAVDRVADVWLDGAHLGRHEGGQTPFSFIVDEIDDARHELIVRAVDDPHDVFVPRGKQDWREHPHAIWYDRTSGIWQPVWLETLPRTAISHAGWRVDVPAASVTAEVELDARPEAATWITVLLRHAGEVLAESRVRALDRTVEIPLSLTVQRNGQRYEELLWTPETPTLIEAELRLEIDGAITDAVGSYVGLRSVSTEAGHVLLNDRPVILRAVLAQNYWPESLLAAPDGAALRREVELIRELGFNTARVHQKAEDPRFLYWADRLGLMIWGETASAYGFDARAVGALTTEWLELVRRDASHPSIIAWVPLNESWGVQHIAHDPRQSAFSRGITALTRAVDGTRPVVSNDGWEHTDSDLWTIHDYEGDPAILHERYRDAAGLRAMLAGFGPAGRRLSIGAVDDGQPVLLTEFGGVSLTDAADDSWGYTDAVDPVDFERRVTSLLRAVSSSTALAGFCYTQLTDTGQETNGLLDAQRRPKIPAEVVRAAVRGSAPDPESD